MSRPMNKDVQAAIEAERRALELFDSFILDNRAALLWIGHWGDGRGGYLGRRAAELLYGPPPPRKGKRA